jgi:putative DNA primase/helicase
VIPFDRFFTEKEEDKELFERIRANELPGVLNKALKGYIRLQKRQRFKLPKTIIETQAHWLEQANPVPAFLEACCIKKTDTECWMKNLYPAYREWASQAGFTIAQNQLSFRRNLEHLGYKSVHGNRGDKVIGLSLRT